MNPQWLHWLTASIALLSSPFAAFMCPTATIALVSLGLLHDL